MHARIGAGEAVPGMLAEGGRVVVALDGRVTLYGEDGALTEVTEAGLTIDLLDRATFWLALDTLARRTGLDPSLGLLWQLQDDPFSEGFAWVLESADEVRTRDGDTEDPLESLSRALVETAKA